MARTARINIMADESVKERLEFMASKMGLTVSGLGSFIIGQWLYQQESFMGPLLDVSKQIMERSISKIESDFNNID